MGNTTSSTNGRGNLTNISQLQNTHHLNQPQAVPTNKIKKVLPQEIELSQLNTYLLRQNLYEHEKDLNQFLQNERKNNTNLTCCTMSNEQKINKNDNQEEYNTNNTSKNNQIKKQSSQSKFLNSLEIQNQQNLESQQRSSITQFSQTTQQFRNSFYSDRSQTTIYLQPPEFIIRQPILMDFLHKLIFQFMEFSYFIGDMAIKLYRLASVMIFVELIFNAGLGFFGNIQCLEVENNGIMKIATIMQIDSLITALLLIFLYCNYILVNKYKIIRSRNRRRHNQYYNKIRNIVTSSWIILYCIKFFILNSVQSVQFFNHTLSHQNKDNGSNDVSNLNVNGNSLINNFVEEGIVRCSSILNVYITSSIIYNYVSIVFLCVFVVQYLV